MGSDVTTAGERNGAQQTGEARAEEQRAEEQRAEEQRAERVRDYAARAGGMSPRTDVLRLKGDASNRSYYRVRDGERSAVVMVMPREAGLSEEATKGAAPTELPFLNVQRYLSGLGVRVPRILHYAPEEGLLLLEDLGDVTFESALDPQTREPLYERAVDLLAAMRARADRRRDPACIAFGRAFDFDLYRWELEHFHEWGLVARSGLQPTEAERRALAEDYERIARALDALPRGFTHRDYQSRNLMLKGGELVVIDFQDALLGPRQYDLVALLRDSYVELERPLVERLVARYCEALRGEGEEVGSVAEFLDVFDLLTVQRKLKDGGRFIFIDRVKKNPGFLPSVPASFRYVREALARRPELARLREILARYVPELA